MTSNTMEKTISQKLSGYIQVFRNTKEIRIYDNPEFCKAIEAMDKKMKMVKKNDIERNDFVNVMLSEDVVKIFSDILEDQLPDIDKRKGYDLFSGSEQYNITRKTFYALNSLVDLSEEIATAAIKDGWCLLPTLKKLLESLKDNAVQNKLSKNDRQFVNSVLVMLYNLVMHDKGEIIHYVREEGLIDNIKPYLKCTDALKMFSFLFLLYVSNEQDACTDEETITYLINTTMAAVKSAEKEKNGFKSMELLRAVEKLSALDVDKYILYQIGVVKHMKTILEESKDNAEILICLGILTNIAFAKEPEVAKAINEEITDLLADHKDDEIFRAQQGLRWVLLQKTSTDCRPRALSRCPSRMPENEESGGSAVGASSSAGEKHVMISYQWDSQEKVRKIKDYLKARNFKVWYDEESMEGDIMDSMANAVENAFIILVCFSRKYKLSKNCRMEAQYAMKLKHEIIPLRMEDYDPDGWLGLMIGTQLYYDFTKLVNENELCKLINALERKKIVNTGSDETLLDSTYGSMQDSITPKSTRPLTMPDGRSLTVSSTQITQDRGTIGDDTRFLVNWKKDDIDKWFSEIDLDRNRLGVTTGGDVRTLFRMYRDAPSVFYKYMLKNLSLSELTRFIEGSEKLLHPQELPQIHFDC